MVGTEIAVPLDQPNGLAVWAQGAREVHQLAEHVSSSALVPQAYRGKPVDVLACWLTGQELGIAPMAALRSIDVIQGTPSLRAHAMRALVQSHGHQVQIVGTATPTAVTMRGRRKGEQDWQEVTWTIDRAKALGLTDKQQWKTQPQTMLIARATGEICRLVAADVLYAVPYTTEEVADEPPIQATATITAADLTRPTSAPPVQRVVDIGDAPVVDPPAGQSASGPQLTKINVLMGKADITEREAKLAWLSELVGRTVTTSKDLTRTEAHRAIERLEDYLAREGDDGQNLDPAGGTQ